MEEKYQKEYEAPPNIYKELPPLKSDKIIKWLKKDVFKERYLFYNKNKKQAICSNCGEVNIPNDVKHNNFGICPKCESRAQYKSMGIGKGKIEGKARVLIFQKKGKSVYATVNMIYADYKNCTIELFKDCEAVYKFNRKEQIGYFTSYSNFYGGKWNLFNNIRAPYRDGTWKDVKVYLYKENLNDAFKNTDLKYCDLPKQVDDWYPESFLKRVDLNAKFESVEKLHKVGLDNIIESKIQNKSGSAAVKWKKDNLKDILGLTKDEIYYARLEKITMPTLEKYKKAKKAGMNISFSEAEKLNIETVNVIYKMRGLAKPEKLSKYLKKQSETNTIRSLNTTTGDYSDYINECKKLELDLKDKAILFPRNLTEAHARTSAQIHVLANKEEAEEIKKRAKKMKKLNYSDKNLIVRVAESAEEIILEGKIQGHCVGGYVGRVARGDTSIFLIRELMDPDKPLYTLELKKGKLVQCRGYKNCNMTDEVKIFVDKWIEEVVNKKSNKNKHKVA